jgi:hypothetical protein
MPGTEIDLAFQSPSVIDVAGYIGELVGEFVSPPGY